MRQTSSSPPVRRSLLASSAAFLLAVTGLAAGGALPTAEAAPAVDTTRVFVRLDTASALAAVDRKAIDTEGAVARSTKETLQERRSTLRAQQRRFVDAANEAGIDVRAEQNVTGLVNGLAVTVPTADQARLARLPGVAAVVPDTVLQVNTETSVDVIGAPEVWEGRAGGKEGARGEGVTVAVIDSGVDYTHPDLGAGLGAGHKVVAGYDFVNNDDDPADDNGHGTHVAGIIAADGKGDPERITGVAPDAEITAYKVMNSNGSGYLSDIIAGLDAAVDPANPHRADVVNMSLGGPGDGTDELGLAATRAVDMGVVVVASSGNSGPGAQTVGTPAAARGVLSVGASASGITMPVAREVSPRKDLIQTFRVPYSASPPTRAVTAELVDVGECTEEDYARVGDIRGKAVACHANMPRASRDVKTYMIEHAKLAEDRGAVAMFGYSGSSGGPVLAAEKTPTVVDQGLPGTPGAQETGDDFRMDKIVVMGLHEFQWPELQTDLAQGPVRVTVGGEDVTDQIASFSSRGPTDDFRLSPDLVAPGMEISSTFPTNQWAKGKYRMSGTSMAAPHVAGAAALLRQLRPDSDVDDVRARLIGSAKPARDDSSPTGQGAGRLDVAAAADAQLTASPATLSLGLADLSRTQVQDQGRVTLRNSGDRTVTLDLTAEAAPGSTGKASVTPSRVRVRAGGSATVTVRVSGPRPEENQDLTGWLVAESTQAGVGTLRVPYLLAARPLVVQTTPDPSDGRSTAFVYSPTGLSAPPTLTLTPPRGRATTVPMVLDHGTWYRAPLTGAAPGTYTVSASADTATGTRLVGRSYLEVLPEDNRPGRDRWEAVGPNGEAGDIATTASDPSVAALSGYQSLAPWTTDDAGQTWTQHTRLPVAAGEGNMVLDSRKPKTMWYAVNSGTDGILGVTLDPTYQGQILRTEDGGGTWQRLDFPDVRTSALVSDAETRVLVAVSTDALRVSWDGGDHWTSLPNPLSGSLEGAAIGGDDLYLADASGVWVVRGLARQASQSPQAERIHTASADVGLDDLVADDELVAVLNDDDEVVGSRDGGRTWSTLFTVPGKNAMYLTLQGDVLAVLTYVPTNHVSRDHGVTWSALPGPVRGASETDVAPWGTDGLLWSSGQAGMFRTGNDGSDPVRIGVQAKSVYDLAVASSPDGQPRLLAGTRSDVYRTDLPTGRVTPQTKEWGLSGSEATNGATVRQVTVDPKDPKVVWKVRKDALSQFRVHRSTDGGETWTMRGVTNEVTSALMVSPHDSDRVTVAFDSLAGPGLYQTRNAGTTWKKLYHDRSFTSVVADPKNPERLWLGSSDGLFRSDDFGVSVVKVTDGEVNTVSVSPDARQIVIGGTDVRVSHDGGRTFRQGDISVLPTRISEIIASPTRSSTLYAATSSYSGNGLIKGGRGVLRSVNGGRTWQNISGGLQNLNVLSLVTSRDGRWLFAGTEEGGVHRLRIS